MTRDEFIREQLSKDYPRLDIHTGSDHARPWQKDEHVWAEPMWKDESGELRPFAPLEPAFA